MKLSTLLSIAILGIAVPATLATPITLYFSTTPPPATFPLAGTLVPANPSLSLTVGQTKSLYIWASFPTIGDIVNSLGLDIRPITAGVVSGSAVTIDNPTYAVGRGTATRWDSATTGTANTSGNLFTNLRPFAVNNAGLNPNQDSDSDSTFGSFFVGKIDITGTAAGTTGIKFVIGDLTFSYKTGSPDVATQQIFFGTGDTAVSGTTVGATSTLADATVTVTSAVPEPASVAIVASGVMLLLGRRRRKGATTSA